MEGGVETEGKRRGKEKGRDRGSEIKGERKRESKGVTEGESEGRVEGEKEKKRKAYHLLCTLQPRESNPYSLLFYSTRIQLITHH